MTRPTKHPKSGTYRLRKAIPAHLRGIIQARHNVRRELVVPLGTKDPKEAARRAPEALQQLDAILRAAQAEHDGAHVILADRELDALCGRWLAAQEAEAAVTPAPPFEDDQEMASYLGDMLQGFEKEGHFLSSSDLALLVDPKIGTLLADTGLSLARESRRALQHRLLGVMYRWHRDRAERSCGQFTVTQRSSDFPTAPRFEISKQPEPAVTLDGVLAGFAADKGWRHPAGGRHRGLYERERTMGRLATFLGHRDASKVVKADVARWKADMQGRELRLATIRNDLSEMSAIWKWGLANGAALPHGNPFTGTLPPKQRRQDGKQRPYTDEEARMILTAARELQGPLRWLPWVCCFTGARLGELVQSVREDVSVDNGIHVVRIHEDGEGRSLKNAASTRRVPLHPALVAEGFTAYVAALSVGSALLPEVAPGPFGRRADNATKIVARWTRLALGITDPKVSPSHSWRHWFVDACRQAEVPQEVLSALTGHVAAADESAHYGRGVGSFVALLARHLARVKSPLAESPFGSDGD